MGAHQVLREPSFIQDALAPLQAHRKPARGSLAQAHRKPTAHRDELAPLPPAGAEGCSSSAMAWRIWQ